MKITAKLDKAYQLGRKAHKDGKPAAPALSAECMQLAEGLQIGQCKGILAAFIQGWTRANLAN